MNDNLELLNFKTKSDTDNIWFDAIFNLANEIIKECNEGRLKSDLTKIKELASEIKVFTY